jgi:hypothetical protein
MSNQQVLELPPNQTLQQLQTLLNDRLRDLNLILNGLMSNPATADLDMANFQIHNLADPSGDLDAVNLRTLKRGAAEAATAPVAAPASSGGGAYAIVFNVGGFLGPDEQVPAYIVGRDRTGTAAEAWVYALGAPSLQDFTFQLTKNGTNILASAATLPVGSMGPVFFTAFSGGVALEHGDVMELVPLGGSAGGISVGLVVERT